jgi:adiponectin receptor
MATANAFDCSLQQFPEKFFPRTFDILGASHQIYHITLLAGAIAYYFALLQQFGSLHDTATRCVDAQ